MSAILDAARSEDSVIGAEWLPGDATTLVITGSEPVAAALTSTQYKLARHLDQQTKLRTELHQSELDTDGMPD